MTKKEEELLNALLAALISADSDSTNEDRKKNIESLRVFLGAKDLLNEHQREVAESGIKLLQKEILENV